MLRRLISISLVLIFMAPGAAAYLALSHQKTLIRKQVKAALKLQLDLAELEYFCFTKQEVTTLLEWEHAKEFEYQGQMYDVVIADTVGDQVEYWCWWDHEETKLNRQVREMVAGAMHSNPTRRDLGIRLSSLFKTLIDHPAFTPGFGLDPAPQNWATQTHSFSSLASSPPLSPPPQLLV